MTLIIHEVFSYSVFLAGVCEEGVPSHLQIGVTVMTVVDDSQVCGMTFTDGDDGVLGIRQTSCSMYDDYKPWYVVT